MGQEIFDIINKISPRYQNAYEDGFNDHKKMIIRELKKLISRIEEKEAFTTTTCTFPND